jgi:thiamine biosynthesis lipoprotein ApbE
VTGAVLAATVMSRATEADAFSTALLVLGSPGLDVLARAEPGAGLLVAEAEVGNQSPKVSVRGIRLQPRSG